jgi:hypothetical protein
MRPRITIMVRNGRVGHDEPAVFAAVYPGLARWGEVSEIA